MCVFWCLPFAINWKYFVLPSCFNSCCVFFIFGSTEFPLLAAIGLAFLLNNVLNQLHVVVAPLIQLFCPNGLSSTIDSAFFVQMVYLNYEFVFSFFVSTIGIFGRDAFVNPNIRSSSGS
jgi:hypothetical protein